MSVEAAIQNYRERLAQRTMPKRISFADVYDHPAPARQRPPRSFSEWCERNPEKYAAARAGRGVNLTTVEPVKPSGDPVPLSADERRARIRRAAIRSGSIGNFTDWQRLNKSLGGAA